MAMEVVMEVEKTVAAVTVAEAKEVAETGVEGSVVAHLVAVAVRVVEELAMAAPV